MATVKAAGDAPALAVFAPWFGAAAKVCDPLTEVVSKSSITDKTKSTTKEALREAADVLKKVGSSLDDLHLGAAEMDRSEVAANLKTNSETIIQIATAHKTVSSLHEKTKKTRDAADSAHRKAEKAIQSHAEQAKLVTQYEKLNDNYTTKASQLAELETELASQSKQVNDNEARIGEERKTLLGEVTALRTEHERLKQLKKSTENIRKELEEKRVRKAELMLQMESVMRVRGEEEEPGLKAPPDEVTDDDGQVCSVCGDKEQNQMVILVPCCHFICRKDMLGEIEQSQRLKREFKYHVCPACFEIVQGIDGGDLLGEVVFGSDGQARLELSKPGWKTQLCTAYAEGKCPLERAQCPYAHGQRDLAKS